MLNDQRASTSYGQDDHDQDGDEQIRDIHALTPPHPAPPVNRGRRREIWETSSHRSSSTSMASEGGGSENFTSMSREFSALVLAGSSIGNGNNDTDSVNTGNNLGMIGEDETPEEEETNPLAIVPDHNPLDTVASSRRRAMAAGGSSSSSSMTTSGGGQGGSGGGDQTVSIQRVKKEEVESKILAWQNAKVAKINNRFKREEAVINGCESEEVQKANSWMKKVERKLEEKRARALEKMQNRVAKARRRAEEKRASAEAKRGTKAARVIEIANLMRAVGRAPAKRSFF
ncbi:hypothetical protein FNV43_RR16479 [Rhamnella rubrinervis]|uniref:Remorin C-terminal domain-containing protein n=1 Tax=Rhamnella rubrinervis TaxID=2594499 RepID=A0A8K0GYV0_9ROSA|nr:hypothetical protein FNV43_RR16479 [Rhamnella rubrinervis]